MAAKLKTFITSNGLTDFVVATTSRPKALAAWGVSQDLFKTGTAQETDDAILVRAAEAQAGDVLERPAGGGKSLGKLKAAKPPKPKGPSKAQLARVADAEAKLEALEASVVDDEIELNAERAALEARAERARNKREAERSELQARLAAARASVTK